VSDVPSVEPRPVFTHKREKHGLIGPFSGRVNADNKSFFDMAPNSRGFCEVFDSLAERLSKTMSDAYGFAGDQMQ